MGVAAFAAGAVAALLLLRLVLAVIGYIESKRRTTVRTMVVLGSGGHTAEMMALLQGMDLSVYQPRCYVVAATDAMSGQKAAAFEAAVAPAAAAGADEEAPPSAKKRTPGKASPPAEQPGGGSNGSAAVRRSPRVAKQQQAAKQQQQQQQQGARRQLPGARSPESPAKRRLAQQVVQQQHYSVVAIPRSREVLQSFISSVPTTLKAFWAAVSLVLDHQPDLLLVNGPGTCIPVAVAAFLLRLLGICPGRVVYVESIARVYRLSLSGKILYHSCLAHCFVQWEELRERYPRAIYAGRLM